MPRPALDLFGDMVSAMGVAPQALPQEIPSSKITTERPSPPAFKDFKEKQAWYLNATPDTHIYVDDPRDVPQNRKYSTFFDKETVKDATKVAVKHGLEPQALLTALWDETVFGQWSSANLGHYNMGREDYPEGTAPRKLFEERWGKWINSEQYNAFMKEAKDKNPESAYEMREIELKYMKDWYLNRSAEELSKSFRKHGPFTLEGWHFYSGYGKKAYGGQNVSPDTRFFDIPLKDINFARDKPQGRRKMDLYPGVKSNREIKELVDETVREMRERGI